ncbi:Uncharacterized protein BM_BM1134 [Brugia malayi]|uniref:Bm1134 n=1 Tax=Brugia malayi TaxID=6279 RepID=A0A0J9XN14_BRUMA|nr:Uncharacterized protein BM_BM1134 [Brugia malayi]CDP91466.1 Bm1134 [Brugia malayi]VIO87906.1 Uncharacterized protein BM_BM1134 [Brugia malayi]
MFGYFTIKRCLNSISGISVYIASSIHVFSLNPRNNMGGERGTMK